MVQNSEVHDIGWFTYEEIKELTTFDNVIKTISKVITEMSMINIAKKSDDI